MVDHIKGYINKNFHALTHKDYRLFFFSYCFSLIGTWMQNITQSWLALQLTNSPLLLSLISVMQMLPLFFLSLFAGVISDSFPKKKIMIICQSFLLVQAIVISILILLGNLKYEYLLIASLTVGICNAFDFSARQSFAIEIVGKEDLANAITLNSAIFNLARLIGPMVASSVMLLVGAGWCYFINALTFIPYIIILFLIKTTYIPKKQTITFRYVIESAYCGIQFILKNKILLFTILATFVMHTFTFNFNVLLPVMAKINLRGNEQTYGLLMSSMGFGALIGAFISANINNKIGPNTKNIMLFSFFTCLIMILTGFSKNLPMVILFTMIQAVFMIIVNTNLNAVLQINSTDENRGRIMSIYSLTTGSASPLGSIISGSISDGYSANSAYFFLGSVSMFLMIVLKKIFKKS